MLDWTWWGQKWFKMETLFWRHFGNIRTPFYVLSGKYRWVVDFLLGNLMWMTSASNFFSFFCSQAPPEHVFANRAGLEMMDANLNNLSEIQWDKSYDNDNGKPTISTITQVLQMVNKLWVLFMQWDLSTKLFTLRTSGLCVSTSWGENIKGRKSCWIWKSSCLESDWRRWESAMYSIHACQLVFYVIIAKMQSFYSFFVATETLGDKIIP